MCHCDDQSFVLAAIDLVTEKHHVVTLPDGLSCGFELSALGGFLCVTPSRLQIHNSGVHVHGDFINIL